MPEKDDYQPTVMACAIAAKMLGQWDLPAMIASIDQADTVGPVFNPTLYLEKHHAMAEDRELLEAARPLWLWFKTRQEARTSDA